MPFELELEHMRKIGTHSWFGAHEHEVRNELYCSRKCVQVFIQVSWHVLGYCIVSAMEEKLDTVFKLLNAMKQEHTEWQG